MTTATAATLSKERLKTWLRMLAVMRSTEQHLREFLRVEHDTTLPRFDVMAALWRHPDGLTMSNLGRLLLVSGGNVTTVVDRLEADGFVTRTTSETDRRVFHVSLTRRGRVHFERMAAEHEAEIDQLFSGISAQDIERLNTIFKRMTRVAP